jgi:sirohydrochlorin cobaltochelatase
MKPNAVPVGIPLLRPARSRSLGPSSAPDGVLLVGHGSACKVSDAQTRALVELVAAALPDVAVELGYLEMTDPPAGESLDRLVAHGCRRVVVLPLMLLAAGHGKSDVPAVVVEGRQRHPQLELTFGAPLGVARALVETAGTNLLAAGAGGLPLLMVARGTSDPDANGDACKAARLVGEWIASPFVHTAFTGVTGPTVTEGLEVFAALGHRRIGLAFWFLAHGKLIERAREEVAAFVARTGVEVVDVGHLGADPRLVPVVVERWREAREGAVTMSCDTCSYRAPFPGLGDRVGQAIGVGHSHLAAEHRHHHH